MNSSEDSSLLKETTELLLEIEDLKKQLKFETQQHKHWEALAMVFHDALWNELRHAHQTSE